MNLKINDTVLVLRAPKLFTYEDPKGLWKHEIHTRLIGRVGIITAIISNNRLDRNIISRYPYTGDLYQIKIDKNYYLPPAILQKCSSNLQSLDLESSKSLIDMLCI